MLYKLPTLLLLTTAATALPLNRRQGPRIDEAATREAHRKDETATRAATAVAIKTPSGQCLSIDENSGDFRKNLQAVVEAPCTGAGNQQFDIITRGVHNDRDGAALIVSSTVFSCLNFDPRRQPGNQVLTFSCGGRADGGGQVTDSQLFEFANSSATTIPLAPLNARGSVCFSVVDSKLDQSNCQSSNPAANQLFTLGNAAPSTPTPSAPVQEEPVDQPTEATPQPPAETVSPGPAPARPTGSVRLDITATEEAHRRDDGATRAFANVPIKTSTGNCLEADVNTGDFRQNLMVVREATCNGGAAQQWDFITAGIHNDRPGTTLIVSSSINSCLNFDDRRAEGNKVLTFSCGGRADGEGRVTDSQLFPFPDSTATSLALAPVNGRSSVCFSIGGGTLTNSNCDATSPAVNQVFTIGDATPALPQPPAEEPVDEPSETAAQPPAETQAPSPAPAVPTGSVRLDLEATAEAQRRDNGATRAFTAVAIKTSNGNCLEADVNTGDFRQNLMAVREVTCNGGAAQQWDFITAGLHNDRPGTTLIVSSSINSCLNFDDRRPDGNKVITFSCGGRADGEGGVTDSQLFPFPDPTARTLALAPVNGRGSVCFANNGGTLDKSNCDSANPAPEQIFTIA